jgi:hypothetical protein
MPVVEEGISHVSLDVIATRIEIPGARRELPSFLKENSENDFIRPT